MMAADVRAALGQAPIAEEAGYQEPTTETRARVTRHAPGESLRERIARHLAGTAPASNYEAMCEAIAHDAAGRPACEHCGGHGHRLLPRHVREEYDEREEHRLEDAHLREQLVTEPARQHGDDEGEQRKRDLASVYDNIEKLGRVRENRDRDQRARNRRTICRACRGSGVGPRAKDFTPGRPDSMFSTVTCPTCCGRDARQHPLFPTSHRGSSTGELRLRGPRRLRDPNDPEGVYTVESDPKDDRAAELGDQCPTCRGDDGMGQAFVVPITVRPGVKGSSNIEDPHGVDDLPDNFPKNDYPDPIHDPHEPEGFLETVAADDPLLAAAIAAYVGPQGDRWATHTWERRFALFPFTDDGRLLATEARARSQRGAAYERLLDLCQQEREAETGAELAKGSPRRRSLIARADDAARRLERRVERALREGERC